MSKFHVLSFELFKLENFLAILIAASFASAPELQKNTLSANVAFTSSAASLIEGSVRYKLVVMP
ncbi:MAG: hypothetical protein CM1200mP30_12720 [Pseudomonadota bacterium]|nr:MAG: hypothetical protein CM1200mP30_12720 [Pseudomonadota bacterium]